MSKILTTVLALSFCLQAFSQCASQTVIPDSIFDHQSVETNGSCISYRLNKPIVGGVPYTITVVLTANSSCNQLCTCYAQCQIYASNTATCGSGELLWESNPPAIGDGLNSFTIPVNTLSNVEYISIFNYYDNSWGGCSGAFTIDSFSLISSAIPLVVSAQVNNNACPDSNGRAVVHASGYEPFSYLWSNGETDSVLSHVPAGTYTVRVEDSTDCIIHDTITIDHQSPESATISVAGDTLISIPATSYQWYLNGNAISGATSENYVAQQNGTYDVVIVDSTGCTSSASNYIPIVNITGITTTLNTANIRLSPNPATNSVTIYSDNLPMVLKLYDLTSREITSKELSGSINNLDVSQIAKGMYLVNIQQGEKQFCQKLIIQ